MHDWHPDQYLRFEAYRTLAARDLLARVADGRAAAIVDLGCGPGNSTALLHARWPDAVIHGVDHSPAMLERARATDLPVTWVHADLQAWEPRERVDLLFANAALQWVPGHVRHLPRWMGHLHENGTLAFQVPAVHDQPAAEVYRRCALRPRWRDHPAPDERTTVATPGHYHEALSAHSRKIEIWETVYHHQLAGPEEMTAWYASTGLRPFLATLPDDESRQVFLAELTEAYRRAFPSQADGTVLFPFRRLFVVAVR